MFTRRSLTAALALLAAPAGAAELKPPVVTLLGDSITAGLGLAAADALPAQLQAALGRIGVRAVVRGAAVSGDTTAGALARLDFSVQSDTGICVIELGANDFFQSVEPRVIRGNLEAIIRRLHARHIHVVLGAGNAPAGAGAYGRAFDAAFQIAAKATGAALVPDLLKGVIDQPGLRQPDGIHPNPAGVKIIANRLAHPVAEAIVGKRRV